MEDFKRRGLDLIRDHAADFPQEYLDWLDRAYRMSPLDFLKDCEIQTEIYDAIQGVLNTYDLLVTPTLVVYRGRRCGRWQHEGTNPYSGRGGQLQVIGRRYADDAVLTASAAFERIQPWRPTYERCAARPI